ncbi:putative quinol monooxygenase [Pontixanthobacter aquaemixtae]|uniref:Antibiotic biosynthesis monooxygenase n=1 Tax=Pontixanthobacter aquaemixtae TaxID=1958940 RepID=A0A844ZSI2_9SPHN|nr:putative quinol monooxygenase [Pontixanthobacter aquaemixtae]MXO89757.1 antibiotic biosynthesis monooxygenase [Pontixanthobacter aquaemixtae]
MITVIGKIKLPVDQIDGAREALVKTVKATRAEEGCIEYNFAEDLTEPGVIRISEVWDDKERLSSHFQSAHMVEFMAVAATLDISEREVTMYEVSGSAPL